MGVGGCLYLGCVRYAMGQSDACGASAAGVGADASDLQQVKPSEAPGGCGCVKSAYQWHQLWRDGGVEALASRGPGGSGCRLSPPCLEKLAGFLEEGPAAHGWVGQVWTASRVATLIHRTRRRSPLPAQGSARAGLGPPEHARLPQDAGTRCRARVAHRVPAARLPTRPEPT